MKLKLLLTNWRVLLLLLFLLFAVIIIKPQLFGTEGVVIRSIALNSSASAAGIPNPFPEQSPLQRERILAVNGQAVNSPEEFYQKVGLLRHNQTVRLETSKNLYTLTAAESGVIDLGIKVAEAPTSNLRKGLDLEGGTRVLLQAAESASPADMEVTIANLKERLNVYGLSDVVVRSAADLSGQQFILIEIAGVTEEEVKELLAKQGKFEGKIGNETVFFGGKKDITYVCRSAECSGLDPSRGCSKVDGGYACSFFFAITLSPEAAERQALLTNTLTPLREGTSCYLSQDLFLYLDDREVDSLRIGCELKGRATTNIQISGSGTGLAQEEAIAATLQNMKKLQTILITGSLPVKLETVKLDTISPSLGKEFSRNLLLAGIAAVIAVVGVVALRYRRLKIVIPMAAVLISEMVLVLGFAALVGWNLDLAAIAGIIIVAGTGVDHLIVITDETVRGEAITDWKRRIKNAMFIIMGAYLTVVAGMIPLWFAGAGLLKGFAFTTIVGISFGVLIARPAYAAIIEKILQEQ